MQNAVKSVQVPIPIPPVASVLCHDALRIDGQPNVRWYSAGDLAATREGGLGSRSRGRPRYQVNIPLVRGFRVDGVIQGVAYPTSYCRLSEGFATLHQVVKSQFHKLVSVL